MAKVITAEEAVSWIKDGDVLTADGVTFGVPEELFIGLEKRFLASGRPRDLTVFAVGGAGDLRGRGFDHLAHEGLVKRVCSSYYNLTRKLGQLILENKVEGYLLPLGVSCQLFREIAAGRPGLITKTGLDSCIDPRIGGIGLNSIANCSMFNPETISLQGETYLFYKSFHLDVAFLRGTFADEKGNFTMEKEAGFMNALAMAMATKKCGGKVIVQVEDVVLKNTLKPQLVKVPGFLIDAIVIAEPQNHMQTWRHQYDPAISGEIRRPKLKQIQTMLNPGKIIGRRAILELRPGMVVNVGAGISEYVTTVAKEEDIYEKLAFIVEAGMMGGLPNFGLIFNTAINHDCVIDEASMADFFDGGGHDVTVVGFAQFDQDGNVNVSKLPGKIPGVGGFLDVAPNARQRIHCGFFTAGESDIRIKDGKLSILKDGEVSKFVQRVDQITLAGAHAKKTGQVVKIITERAVFEWKDGAFLLKEIAPGINLKEQVLEKMGFEPILAPDLKEMPAEIFQETLLDLNKRAPWIGAGVKGDSGDV